MAAQQAAGAALLLQAPLPFPQLARITLPLPEPAPADQMEELGEGAELPPGKLPPALARLDAAGRAVAALSTHEAPFLVNRLDSATLQLVCSKAVVGAVFKALRMQQTALGLVVGAVAQHIALGAPPPAEMTSAAFQAVQAALRARGWWRLSEGRLLSTDLLEAADGKLQTAQCVSLAVEAAAPNRLTLLLKPATVRFLHIAATSSDSSAPDLGALEAKLAGSRCCVLPDEREGLVDSVGPADDPALLARLRSVWLGHGLTLPAEIPFLLHVRFDLDEDAPAFPYPPCAVLSRAGLDAQHDKLTSPAVRAILARVKDDLCSASPAAGEGPAPPALSFWGGKSLSFSQARVWYPEGLTATGQRHQAAAADDSEGPAPASMVFQSALQLTKASASAAAAAAAAAQPALGDVIDLSATDLAAGAGMEGGIAGAGPCGGGSRPRRKYTLPDAQLREFLDSLQVAEQATPATAPTGPATASKPPITRTVAAPASGPPVAPGLGGRKPLAPAAAKAGATGGGGGQKRQAGAAAKPPRPAAPKKVKPAAGAGGVAANAAGGAVAGGGTVAGGSEAAPPAMAPAYKKPEVAVKVAKAACDSSVAAAGRGTAAAKPAGKPRAKAADVDVAAVTAKVQAAAAGGTLGKLTLPELKAFLKSVKKPVGGKKEELVARLAEHLGAGSAAAPAAALV